MTPEHPTLPDRLAAEAVEHLRGCSTELTLAVGDTVVREGDPGRAFYAVLEGELEVRLAAGGGRAMALARLGPGDTFGEISLLRAEAVSADVVAVTPATVLACPADRFHTALADCAPLRRQLLSRLAGDLRRTTQEAWDFFQKAEAMRLLVHDRGVGDTIVAVTARMQGLVREIGELAADNLPVLISGAPGTGKLLAARTLHRAAGNPEAPLIIIDCQRLEGSDGHRLLLGGAEPHQVSGTAPGAIHLARGGTLVLRHVECLDPTIQGALAAVMAVMAPSSAPRLVATVRALDGGTGAAALTPELATLFSDRRLHLPPLVERRRDILPLAEHFLARLGDDPPRRFSRGAEHALVSMTYRHHNVAELREAVEVAALCTDDAEIRTEHLFSGPKASAQPTGIDLSALSSVRALVHGGWLGRVRWLVLLSFAAVIAVCLAGGGSALAGHANTFIWAVWEPAVFALFLLLGSVWCTVCPLSTAGRLAQRLASLERPPGQWLKRSGVWLAIAGFFLIVWVERVFHMTDNPPASGLMLLGLITASVAFCMVYTREVWCRHVCPLGALASSLAPSAVLQVGANPGVCTSTCREHSCYRGAASIPGCTVFHHPLDADEEHLCKLCMDCLRSCPHGSARLYLRPPLVGAWRLGGAGVDLAPFACAVSLLSLVLLASRTLPPLQSNLALTAAGVAAVLAGIALHRFALPALFGGVDDQRPAAERTAFALMVLGWGALMADQLANIPALEQLRVAAVPGSRLGDLLGAGQLSILPVAQTAALVLAAVLAAVSVTRIRGHALAAGARPSRLAWSALALLSAAYLVGALMVL